MTAARQPCYHPSIPSGTATVPSLNLDNRIPARQERSPGEVRDDTQQRAKGKQVPPETGKALEDVPETSYPSPQGQIHLVGGRKDMDNDSMTQAELILLLETLAENIELKAETGKEAAEIVRAKAEALKNK